MPSVGTHPLHSVQHIFLSFQSRNERQGLERPAAGKCPWSGHQGGWALQQLTEKSKGANKFNLVMSCPPGAALAAVRMVRSPVLTHTLCLLFEAAIRCLPSNITQIHLLAFEVFAASSLPSSKLCLTFPRILFHRSTLVFCLTSVIVSQYLHRFPSQ